MCGGSRNPIWPSSPSSSPARPLFHHRDNVFGSGGQVPSVIVTWSPLSSSSSSPCSFQNHSGVKYQSIGWIALTIDILIKQKLMSPSLLIQEHNNKTKRYMVSISTTAIIMIMIISIIIFISMMIQALGTITMQKGTWSRSTGHWRQYNEDFHSDFGPYPLSTWHHSHQVDHYSFT